MDQNQPPIVEPTLEESIKEVMQTLPPPIRNYLVQGKYTMVAKSLMLRYSLRIDQAGVLEREIMLLLMGIESPDEFAAALKNEASLTDDVVRSIMADVNEKIFVPLREEMRKAGVKVGTEQPPAPTPPAERKPEIPSVKPEAGVAKPTSFFHLQNKLAPRPSAAPAVPRPQEEKPAPSAPPARPMNPAPPMSGARPGLRDALSAAIKKPLDSGRLLEDHEEPHIEFHKAPPPPPSVGKPPPPPVHTEPARPTAPPPPPNLPGVVQPHVIPPGGRPDITFPKPGAPVVPPPAPLPPPPKAVPDGAPTPAKPYTADPYREPIEEDGRK